MTKTKETEQKTELLIKKSLVKDYVTSKGDYRMSGDSYDKLSAIVMDICDLAIKRAEANGRKTVQKQDF